MMENTENIQGKDWRDEIMEQIEESETIPNSECKEGNQ